ncbi:uncharacterized protein LOC127702005 [Mytilus californianus]|uniref:uncharacterized protein LOC127702005 n=1 Tax=Mytilus californianus TaxID=6549 RepID=UPI002247D1D0|nr:uncharacterized protein LOC127702005 [Mytilus californianus]XP_052061942.1 uncharacterized protein LOC127702005 [Mytilus californianus]
MALTRVILAVLGFCSRIVESLLFVMIDWYDKYVYSPLQTLLLPIVSRIPRFLSIRGLEYTIFSANIVSWTRTALVIPIACCLKNQYYWTAFFLVVFHDFLDHLDGIVAKAQKQIYGSVDDPLLGGFMDAFCDKLVNVFALWSILLTTDFTQMTWKQTNIYITSCSVIIGFEFVLGVVRVQDYFRSYYLRLLRKNDALISKADTAAVMEGKLKEKLESMGIAFLCLAEASPIPITSWSGITGIACLIMSVRLAYASLQHKLKAREQRRRDEVDFDEIPETKEDGEKATYTEKIPKKLRKCYSESNASKFLAESIEKSNSTLSEENDSTDDSIFDEGEDTVRPLRQRHNSVPVNAFDTRVDKVYTVGCFDLFHNGHITLLQRMKALGKQVIVGVHDSRSIFKLKKRVPIDSTEKRMLNVKKYADMVYCVAGTDPTNYIHCILTEDVTERHMYVRGDDMQDFPARNLCEARMTVKFLPYTKGVSSTKRRKSEFTSCNYGTHAKDDVQAIFY